MKFFDKLNDAINYNQSLLCIALDPDPDFWSRYFGYWERVGVNIWRIQEWLEFIILQTTDLVCAYKLNLEFYRVLGSPGLELLRHTLEVIPSYIPVILDAKPSDINSSSIFALTAFSDTGLGLRLNYPIIFPRKELKAHGTRRLVEGKYRQGETVVVIDDILITGKSVSEGAEKLKSVGLNVSDIVVFIDHEEGVKEKLEKNGYRSHAVLTISEIARTLYEAGRVDHEQCQVLLKTPA
jgi:hypothetical protein